MPLYFGIPQSKRSPHYQEGSRINNLIMNWKFAVFLIAIMGSVSVTLAEDSCSGKNRQQMFENFPYRSDEEKACFNTIRGLESKLERAMSHLKFFRCFTASNVNPGNLDAKGHFSFAFSGDAVQKHLQDIDQRYVIKKMNISVSYFCLTSSKLKETITTEYSKLQSICNTDRFDLLTARLAKVKSKMKKELSFKKTKVNNITISETEL